MMCIATNRVASDGIEKMMIDREINMKKLKDFEDSS